MKAAPASPTTPSGPASVEAGQAFVSLPFKAGRLCPLGASGLFHFVTAVSPSVIRYRDAHPASHEPTGPERSLSVQAFDTLARYGLAWHVARSHHGGSAAVWADRSQKFLNGDSDAFPEHDPADYIDLSGTVEITPLHRDEPWANAFDVGQSPPLHLSKLGYLRRAGQPGRVEFTCEQQDVPDILADTRWRVIELIPASRVHARHLARQMVVTDNAGRNLHLELELAGLPKAVHYTVAHFGQKPHAVLDAARMTNTAYTRATLAPSILPEYLVRALADIGQAIANRLAQQSAPELPSPKSAAAVNHRL